LQAVMAQAAAAVGKDVWTFSSSGWLFVYHLGAIQALRNTQDTKCARARHCMHPLSWEFARLFALMQSRRPQIASNSWLPLACVTGQWRAS
jgi:hypothetical protein